MSSTKDSLKAPPATTTSSSNNTTKSSQGSAALPVRQPHSRHHSHSHTLGSLNSAHRIARRKSTSSTNASTIAAVAAAVREAEQQHSLPMSVPTGRRGSSTRSRISESLNEKSGLPLSPGSLPKSNGFALPGKVVVASGSAIVDGPSALSLGLANSKARNRRASEGSALKDKNDLKCDKCGKVYKHGSCLTKHLWEHTPEWGLTSKLLISKHQQVQLLEAASILVSIIPEDMIPEEAIQEGSDMSAGSPVASTFSGETSSAHTTPPPQQADEDSYRFKGMHIMDGSLSRSYQSHMAVAASAPTPSGFAHFAQTPLLQPYTGRDEDESSLAAAVELLSCSFGTPKTGPLSQMADVPPVPPLPEKFLQSTSSGSSNTLTPTVATGAPSSYVRGTKFDVEDVDMMEKSEGITTVMEDDEEGVFGKMEE